MDFNANTATAILAALRLATEHGGADAALRATGIQLPDTDRFEGLSTDFGDVLGGLPPDESIGEALALGFLAGHVAPRRRLRIGGDPTSFVLDRHLVVRGAEGESVMRLPWIDDDLFVGRPLPDITEIPAPLRSLCIEHYSAALAGERRRFGFSSYGHRYSVEAVPVYGADGTIDAVLAIATPARPEVAAAMAYERTAERLDGYAREAEQRAELHRVAGRSDAEAAERHSAQKSRRGAERSRNSAARLRARNAGTQPVSLPSITPRETEVLQLASHGLHSAEIADQLAVSPATIKTHFEHIYAKLGSHDRAAAVAAALRHGLIE